MKRFFGHRQGDYIVFEGSEFTHIARVLRMKEGERVIASLNDDNDYYCTLTEIGKARAVARIEKVEFCKALPMHNIVLFQAMPKREYFESIVTKAVELGVSEVVPFICKFSVNHDYKAERINQIVLTACKQCERSRLIEVSPVLSFNQMLSRLSNYDVVIFAYEKENKSLDQKLLEKKENIAVIVGCEAGFTPEEAEKIISNGGVSISLGNRILRCDTAALATLAVVNILSKN